MKKSNFKQIFLTLALLITAATGAWADGKVYDSSVNISTLQVGDILIEGAQITISDQTPNLEFKNGRYFLNDATTPNTSYFQCDQTATVGANGLMTGLNYGATARPADAEGKEGNAWEVTAVTANSTLIVGITYDPNAVTATLNETNTEATMEMPESDVTVEYSLVRDLTQQVTFGGIPTGDGLVVKNNGTAYEFVTAPTFTLTDGLADNADIISAEGITLTVGKMVEVEGFEGYRKFDETTAVSLADFLANPQPGIYKMKATATADGPYDGTIYSAEFTLVEKYDLALQPADDFSKDKLSEVTVAGAAQTLDADGKATVTNVAPGAEVKLKANRGYVIEKVEAKKRPEFVPGATIQNLESFIVVDNNKDGTITLHMPTLNPATYNVTNSTISNGEHTLHFGYEIGSGTNMSSIGADIITKSWNDHTPFSELDKTIDITSGPRVAILITGHVQSATCPAPGKEHYWGLFRYTNPVKVTYNLGGGSVSGSTADKVEYLFSGDALATTFAAPTREGYTFDGWYTSVEGGTKLTASTATSATTIYAHWTAQ